MDLCWNVEFENGFENDTLGDTGIRWPRLSPEVKDPDNNRAGGNVDPLVSDRECGWILGMSNSR